MKEEQNRHPKLLRQVALFERNPVCALCYRVCMELCKDHGGMQFDLLESMIAADELCAKIIEHAWELNGIEYYRDRVQNRLNGSPPAVACTFAAVCVTFGCMENLPAPVRQLAHDFQGLILGEGNELYENLRSAAYRQDITLAYDTYGEPPPEPSLVREYEQVCRRAAQLEQEVETYKTQLKMKKEEQSKPNITIENHGSLTFIAGQDIHDNTNCPIYLVPGAGDERMNELTNEREAPYQPPIPKEGDYNAVREYIVKRKKYDEDFRIYWDGHNLKQNCVYLTKEFGWIVDDHSLGTNLNRHR